MFGSLNYGLLVDRGAELDPLLNIMVNIAEMILLMGVLKFEKPKLFIELKLASFLYDMW